jgi:hypothetical protein
MVSRNGRFGKHVPLIYLEPLDFCPNSLYPQARQALPVSKSFTVAYYVTAWPPARAEPPKGGAFSPAGQDSLKRTKACTRPKTSAMPLKPEWSPQRAKRSLHKAKEAFNEQNSL